jgi:putative hydrolase of the HAD superfamily
MSDSYAEIFRRNFQPLEPIASGKTPVLRKLDGIRAVMFDIYGTLIISASGEVGSAAEQSTGTASTAQRPILAAFEAMGIPLANLADDEGLAELFFSVIEESHARDRARGIEYPEVDVVDIWRAVLGRLADSGAIERSAAAGCDIERLAVQYEARANPCWPMPHLRKCLSLLRQGGQTMGIISNAQFFTPLVCTALLGETLEDLGFQPDLQYYSYQNGFAKPGAGLFEMAAGRLADRGIGPEEVLYVGNDMLNDILPARKLGFNTALFAGDNRSLRCREGDWRLDDTSPELVLTDLAQLADCVCP